jgi:hypothetical protein
MFEDIIFQKLWLVILIWLVLYIADYYLTILGARYYESGAKDHIVFEGSYELTPVFHKDIDALRMFSPRFFRWVIISTVLIIFLWYVSRNDAVTSFFYRFLCGGLILREVAILIRHARNIALFRVAKEHQGLSGQIRHARWLTYQMSVVDLMGFAIVFVIVYLFTGSVPFLGGSFLLVTTAFKHGKLGKIKPKENNQQNAESDGVEPANYVHVS